MDTPTPQDLERLITEEWPLYHWTFNKEKETFFTDTEIVFCLEIYEGDINSIRQKIISDHNSATTFMGYPMVWTHLSVEVEE